MQKYPEDMDTWKARSKWIVDGFCDQSKRSLGQLNDFLEFCNGDTTQEIVVHWCRGCCASTEESIDKALRLIVPLLSRGYQVPLLYRFKHYARAASFIKAACCCFSLLPRILSQMDQNAANQSDASSRLSGMLDSLMHDSDHGAKDDSTNEPSFQSRLDALLDTDLSFSLQNGLRKSLVCQEVSKPRFCQAAILIDIIVMALESGMHVFFERTALLSRICALGPDLAESSDLSEKSRQSFLRIVSGKLGEELIDRAMNLLGSGLENNVAMGLDASPEQLALFFKLVIACMSDVWRRMVLDLSVYPYKVFQWLSGEFTLDDFVRSWDDMRNQQSRCDGCVDFAFSSVLLAEHPEPLGDKPKHEQKKMFLEMKAVLAHVASYSATNSDTVEIKHGNMQWSVSKRGSQYAKKPKAAKETSLLQSLIRTHSWAIHDTYRLTMPSRQTRSGILKRIGSTGTNQHTKKQDTVTMFFFLSALCDGWGLWTGSGTISRHDMWAKPLKLCRCCT